MVYSASLLRSGCDDDKSDANRTPTRMKRLREKKKKKKSLDGFQAEKKKVFCFKEFANTLSATAEKKKKKKKVYKFQESMQYLIRIIGSSTHYTLHASRVSFLFFLWYQQLHKVGWYVSLLLLLILILSQSCNWIFCLLFLLLNHRNLYSDKE